MSARGLGSVIMVGAVASAALSCYLVSLRVASERAALEAVEAKILYAQRDIRLLETEIGTRGRLAQLERWNVRAIRLSAPTADQLIETSFHLATMIRPERRRAIDAPIVLAAAPRTQSAPVLVSDDSVAATAPAPGRPEAMMHTVSYPRPATRAEVDERARPVAAKPAAKPASASDKPTRSAAAGMVASAGGATARRAPRIAVSDPLAPLPSARSKASPSASTKDSGTP